jgi:mono/diheme cytochrome c family protein
MITRAFCAAAAALGLVLSAGCGKTYASDTTPYQRADLTRGARLFDNWMKEMGVTPTAINPGYLRTKGTSKSVTASWRCAECHGWDYRGVDGANATGSHFTGVQGLLEAQGDPPENLFAVIQNGSEAKGMTAFGVEQSFSDEDIWDLAKFIKEGMVDLSGRIDLATRKPTAGNAAAGKDLYEKGLPGTNSFQTCAYCHGTDGRKINFHTAPQAPEYIGSVATEDAFQFTHHVRFGYSGGVLMPAFHDRGWTVDNVMDVLAYAQTLPAK